MRSAALACIVLLGVVFAMNVRVAASEDGVHWISFEEAVQRSKTEPRKILIDVYTDWCGWCKKMDKAHLRGSVGGRLHQRHVLACEARRGA